MPGGPLAAFAPCPNCRTPHVHPVRVTERDRNRATVAYHRHTCGHDWTAPWTENR